MQHERYRLKSRAHSQFVENMRDVGPDSFAAYRKPSGDLSIVEPVAHGKQHVVLARGEVGETRWMAIVVILLMRLGLAHLLNPPASRAEGCPHGETAEF